MQTKSKRRQQRQDRHLRLDALIRVSKIGDRDPKDLRSDDQQRAEIERRQQTPERGVDGERITYEVIKEHTNFDLSASKVMNRRDIAVVLDRIEAGETDGMIVAFGNRLSRARAGEVALFKDALRSVGGELVICDLGGLQVDTIENELQFTIIMAVNHYLWGQTRKYLMTSRENALEKGLASRPHANFGYTLIPRATMKRMREAGMPIDEDGAGFLVPYPKDDPRAQAVEEIFRRRASGHSWNAIVKWLSRNKELNAIRDQETTLIQTGEFKNYFRSVPQHWSDARVSAIVANRTYLGELWEKERDENGTVIAEHCFKEDAHPALVDRDTWELAQRPGRAWARGGSRTDVILRGRVRCAVCRYTMQIMDWNGEQWYWCVQKRCPRPVRVRGKVLHPFVIDAMYAKKLADQDFFDQRYEGDEQLTDELRKAWKDAEAKQAEFAIDFEQHEAMGREAMLLKQKALAGNVSKKHDVYVAALQRSEARDQKILTPAEFRAQSLESQHNLLATVLRAVFVGPAPPYVPDAPLDDRVFFNWIDEPPADMPRQGRVDYVMHSYPDGHDWLVDAGELVSLTQLCEILGRDHDWVSRHRRELGGTNAGAHWVFHIEQARAAVPEIDTRQAPGSFTAVETGAYQALVAKLGHDVVSVAQLAEMLGRNTMWIHRKRDELGAVRSGHYFYFDSERAVQAYRELGYDSDGPVLRLTDMAKALGASKIFVANHAKKLGGFKDPRLGSGRQAPWLFDRVVAKRRYRALRDD